METRKENTGKQNVAYLRVSTEAQTEKYGLDMQKEKILEYCVKSGVMIDKWYIDGGFSGSTLDRPKIQELLSDAEDGKIENVFVYKLDRMSRDTRDTLDLLTKTLPKYDVRVISMTEQISIDTPMDRVMVTMNAAMNQYEREMICMRTRAGMVERVKKGLWMGGGRVPYGYYYDRNDGILHIDETQAEKVKKAYEMYIDGYSCDKISKILGFKGDRIVTQILKRKSNIGLIVYKGVEYKGLHEPIIDEETFYIAQECMKKRSTNAFVTTKKLLTGLCFCSVCGARMRYHKWSGNHKLICYSHFKSSHDCVVRDRNCNNKIYDAKKIEDEVESFFIDNVSKINDKDVHKNNIGTISELIKKSNAKIKKFYNLYAENDNPNLLELIREEESRVKDLEKELEFEKERELQETSVYSEDVKGKVEKWEEIPVSEKNMILKKCIEKIIVSPDTVEICFSFTF